MMNWLRCAWRLQIVQNNLLRGTRIQQPNFDLLFQNGTTGHFLHLAGVLPSSLQGSMDEMFDKTQAGSNSEKKRI